jgi:hypothetical protein
MSMNLAELLALSEAVSKAKAKPVTSSKYINEVPPLVAKSLSNMKFGRPQKVVTSFVNGMIIHVAHTVWKS